MKTSSSNLADATMDFTYNENSFNTFDNATIDHIYYGKFIQDSM
jgi:hypothetical protein